MNIARLVILLFSVHTWCAAQTPAPSITKATPRVWIFNGTPGDDEHHEFYEQNLASLRKSLTERFAVPSDHITVLYGPKSAGYDGACTRETMLAELAKIVTHTQQPDSEPVWIIMEGHANLITGGAMFNLPGPDLSLREIAEALKDCSKTVPLVMLNTTTASADIVRHFSAPGRFIITATSVGDAESETEFPRSLAEVLGADASDTNRDGVLSLTEIFLATNARVLAAYEKDKWIVKEHAQLDGNGDGKATQRPAVEDAEPADRIGLALGGGKPKFE